MSDDGDGRSRRFVRTHQELDVYQRAFELAMEVFEASRTFPREERYSLTDQIRRASRSVCANIAEAWRRRRYPAAFVKSLTDAEAESAEVQVWLSFADRCEYLDEATSATFRDRYDQVIASIVGMIRHRDRWCAVPAENAKRR